MSMDQLMALVPIEAATSLSTTTSKGRRSRWERSTVACRNSTRFGPKEEKAYNPPPFVDLPPGLTPLQMDQFLREQRLEDLSLKLEKGELEYGDPDIRPPSPPPAYDRDGTRMNMRETRVRNAMLMEHQRLIEFMAKNVPGFIPPTDFKPLKKIRRIIIPQEKYPEYNFMGLIIGPRGCNHKRLESESGAQISIRGRGTQKEGKKTDHQTEEEAAMPQHIHIAADTEESLDKAVALIEPLLNPFHPAHEEFKKKGLEQLALVNGVALTKIDSRCTVCGALGHLNWECPDADFQSFQKANVKCALCGDKGHVTMDCKLAKGLSSEELAEIERKAQGIPPPRPQYFGNAGVGTPGVSAAGGLKANGIPPPPPPPPPSMARPVDPLQLDMEFSQMMSEITRGKEVAYEGTGAGAPSIPDTTPAGTSNVNRGVSPFSCFVGNQPHAVPGVGTQHFSTTPVPNAPCTFNNSSIPMQYNNQEDMTLYNFDPVGSAAHSRDGNMVIPSLNGATGAGYMMPRGYQDVELPTEPTSETNGYAADVQQNGAYYTGCSMATPYQIDAWTQHISQMFGYYPNMYSYAVPQQQVQPLTQQTQEQHLLSLHQQQQSLQQPQTSQQVPPPMGSLPSQLPQHSQLQQLQFQQQQQLQGQQHTTMLPKHTLSVADTSYKLRSIGARPGVPASLFSLPQQGLCAPTRPVQPPLPCPPQDECSDASEDMNVDEPVAPPPPPSERPPL